MDHIGHNAAALQPAMSIEHGPHDTIIVPFPHDCIHREQRPCDLIQDQITLPGGIPGADA